MEAAAFFAVARFRDVRFSRRFSTPVMIAARRSVGFATVEYPSKRARTSVLAGVRSVSGNVIHAIELGVMKYEIR